MIAELGEHVVAERRAALVKDAVRQCYAVRDQYTTGDTAVGLPTIGNPDPEVVDAIQIQVASNGRSV
jgi:hypothetical protein